MKIPLEWLKECVTIRLKPEALAERLTMAGLEVVAIHDVDGQPVFDIEVTPNRPDCLSIIGIAREVAAITGQRLKLPSAKSWPAPARVGPGELGAGSKKGVRRRSAPSSQLLAKILIEDKKHCQRYIGRLIDGVTIKPSPEWMQKRLIACGARPINNVVDITNYVLFEYGQPLHAFDFAKLSGGTILVRAARANESITTLDGLKRTVTPETLVIADAKQAVAVAGIMGGMGSEVTPQTTTVLLESALFDPISIRRTGRRLGLTSESSYRFERGVDPVGVATASARASGLIQELAGGEECRVIDVGQGPAARTVIVMDGRRVKQRLGVPVSSSEIRTHLARLGCLVASSGSSETVRVTVPSFRRDVTHEVDLHEELARLMGYERIPATVPTGSFPARRAGSATYAQRHELQRLCASLGLCEAKTWSLLSEQALTRCGISPTSAARVSNPLSQDHAYVRPSLLMGLLQALRHNVTHGASSIRFFELGAVVPPEASAERTQLGLLISGTWLRDWSMKAQPSDFFLLKGLLEAIAGRATQQPIHLTVQPHPWAEAGQSATVLLGERRLGAAGKIAPRILAALDVKHDAWFAECDADLLGVARATDRRVMAPSSIPAAKRDISFLLDVSVAYAEAARVIQQAAGPAASQVELIDRYDRGAQVPSGKYSLTFSIAYHDPARTLAADEVDALHQRVAQALAQHLGAVRR
ncbi:MAG: phenylalanine--tRNA ligase subunit beta [Candidatus Omnitrophica bacterium]|nr:phenylalanine--tRNA ligase subunit beta [Candidatus Omnitrophota bacterium]